MVVRLIDKAMKRLDTSVRGNMAVEIHKHLHLCQENATKFLGREDELYKVNKESLFETFFFPNSKAQRCLISRLLMLPYMHQKAK